MFKDVYKGALGDKAAKYQTVGFLVSYACAEVIADVLLCPWEAVSITPDAIRPILFMIEMSISNTLLFFSPTVEGPHADLRRWHLPQDCSRGMA